MTRYFPTSTNERDRGYLLLEVAADSVQGSSTVTGLHEGERGVWRLLIFRLSPDGRIPLVRTAPPDDRSRMNVWPWFGSAVLACATHSFLGGGD